PEAGVLERSPGDVAGVGRGRSSVLVHGVLAGSRTALPAGGRERQARARRHHGPGTRLHPGVLARREDARVQPRDRTSRTNTCNVPPTSRWKATVWPSGDHSGALDEPVAP